jgi:hypothetical protein
MNIRTVAWVFGGALAAAATGFAAAACSSSSTPGGATPYDSGTANTMDSGGGGNDDSGNNMPSSDAGTGNECGSTPHLHPGDGGSLYCPFGPDGGAIDCPTGSSICCIGGEIATHNYAVSQCGLPTETCPNPLPDAGKYPARRIECEESTDCAGSGMVCCATGGTPAMDTACNFYRESPGLTAATCTAGQCPAGKFQICASDLECGSGHTCAPFRAVGMQLGFCN